MSFVLWLALYPYFQCIQTCLYCFFPSHSLLFVLCPPTVTHFVSSTWEPFWHSFISAEAQSRCYFLLCHLKRSLRWVGVWHQGAKQSFSMSPKAVLWNEQHDKWRKVACWANKKLFALQMNRNRRKKWFGLKRRYSWDDKRSSFLELNGNM